MSHISEYRVSVLRSQVSTSKSISDGDITESNAFEVKLDYSVVATSEEQAIRSALTKAYTSERLHPYNVADEDLEHETSNIEYMLEHTSKEEPLYHLMCGSYLFRVCEVYKLPVNNLVEKQTNLVATRIIDEKAGEKQLKNFTLEITAYLPFNAVDKESEYYQRLASSQCIIKLDIYAKSAKDAVKLAFTNIPNYLAGDYENIDEKLISDTVDRQHRLSSPFALKASNTLFVVTCLKQTLNQAQLRTA